MNVAIEWIDGMIDFLPFYNADGSFVESENLIFFKSSRNTIFFLNNYPRILKVIQLNRHIDFEKIRLSPLDIKNRETQFEERNNLIFEIISNLKLGFWDKKFLMRKITRR